VVEVVTVQYLVPLKQVAAADCATCGLERPQNDSPGPLSAIATAGRLCFHSNLERNSRLQLLLTRDAFAL
jgi:hypothetical protein